MPLFSIMCNECNAIMEAFVEPGEELKCPRCQSTKVEKLIETPAAFNFNCELKSSSAGKPTSSHPLGTNFLFGKEKDRVKKEKKEMNKALNDGKSFRTGNRKEKTR